MEKHLSDRKRDMDLHVPCAIYANLSTLFFTSLSFWGQRGGRLGTRGGDGSSELNGVINTLEQTLLSSGVIASS